MATPFIAAQPQPKYFSSDQPAESSLPTNFYEEILRNMSPEDLQSVLEMIQGTGEQPGMEAIAGLADTQGQTVGPYKGYVASSPFGHLARGLALKKMVGQGKSRSKGFGALVNALRNREKPSGVPLPEEADWDKLVLGE